MKKVFLILIVFLMFMPVVLAKEGHIKLLAVKGDGTDDYEGSVADLYLDVQPGKGRVFLETYPLSKVDTQISTRFANQIACDYIEEDCDKYDFFYTMNAESSIVGGPSAGAAVAVLTVSLLKDWKLNESVAITGTINAGGLVGPVGGLSAKVEAASDNDIDKVLVSKGSRFVKEDNLTFDVIEYAQSLNVSAYEVVELDDVIYHFTGHKVKSGVVSLDIDSEYKETMKALGEDLCRRAEILQEELSVIDINESEEEIKEVADNMTLKGQDEIASGNFYSGASYCFGADVKYRELVLKGKRSKFEEIEEWIAELDSKADSYEIKTIADLEAYMVAKERLREAEVAVEDSREKFEDGEYYKRDMAYAYERVYSAETWMKFFGKPGKDFEFNDEVLKKSCASKINEAEERFQYANIYFPSLLDEVKEQLRSAAEDFEEEDYALCLFKASKAKAEADSVITVIGISEEDADDVLQNRLKIAKRVIAEQPEGVFPILGYSYYEYANSLAEEDIYSAMLYSQYALELSNLDIYFREEKKEVYAYDFQNIGIFAAGFGLGLLLGILAMKIVFNKNPRKRSEERLRGKKR